MHEHPRWLTAKATRSIRRLLVCCSQLAGMAQAGEAAMTEEQRPARPPVTSPGASAPTEAEFAIRWNPAEGGPAEAERVLALLGLSMPSPEVYRVRYYDLPKPAAAPPQATVILRERTKPGGKTQIRLKYRLDQPLAGSWACPPGGPFKPSSEVDVTWLADGPPKRVFAYSCTLKAPAPPPALKAIPKPCAAEMTRYAAGGLKVEAWRMPRGETQLEVSSPGPDTPEALARFAAVAQRLIDDGAKPAGHSKTELGSACP